MPATSCICGPASTRNTVCSLVACLCTHHEWLRNANSSCILVLRIADLSIVLDLEIRKLLDASYGAHVSGEMSSSPGSRRSRHLLRHLHQRSPTCFINWSISIEPSPMLVPDYHLKHSKSVFRDMSPVFEWEAVVFGRSLPLRTAYHLSLHTWVVEVSWRDATWLYTDITYINGIPTCSLINVQIFVCGELGIAYEL